MLLHDLRNPLATVNVYSQLLLQDARTEGFREGIRIIQEAAVRLEGLVDQLAALGGPRGVPDRAPGRNATDAVELVRRIARGTGRVLITSQGNEILGYWNAVELERLVANLIDNALKYTPAPRPVDVTLRRANGSLVITVADHGIGIPCAEVARVFERGYRAVNAKETCVGDGLGLATVRRIVDAHHGTITVASKEGVGTRVSVRLPPARDAEKRCHTFSRGMLS